MRTTFYLLPLALLLVLTAFPVAAQNATPMEASMDTVRAGRYDNGRMWTFENPPFEYLAEAYGFEPDADWFEEARLSALRIPGCSAAFVSPNGLIVTNHHCARGSILKVQREGENLLDDGFYAASLDEERRIEDYAVEQLIAIEDVTADIEAALAGAQTDAERAQARRDAIQAAQATVSAQYGGEEAGINAQVIALYNGGQYSAYVFRKYTDIRLVAAPEEQLGFFGGDPDNFTYPRFALDFTFYRAYGEDGEPMETANYFEWSTEGVEPGSLVFVIGNPGSTDRLDTVAQLEYKRDVLVKSVLASINDRLAAMRAYFAENPEEGEAIGIRNTIFSLSNSQKAYTGRLEALNDPWVIARRRDAERQFRTAIEADPALMADYGEAFDRMAALQLQRREYAADFGAFTLFGNSSFSSSTMLRALRAHQYMSAQEAGATGEALDEAREQLLGVSDKPRELERRLLAARLADFQTYYGANDPTVESILQGRSPEEAARVLIDGSVLSDSDRARSAVEAGTLAGDPALAAVQAMLPRFGAYQSAFAGLGEQEQEVASQLGRARFAVYGTAVPPDATFSPRITDGVVKGYPFNGTLAPPYTTFFGLYERHYAFGPGTEWDLPERWLTPPAAFDRATPLNFVSTADTIGGNSGSPVVNRNQEIVGLNFDRNIQGLSRDYIFLPERGRNVSVDVRAILEALDDIYDADRVVLELTTTKLAPTEADADVEMAQ